MVTAKTQYRLKHAQSYFEEHLSVGDYYEEGQRVTGEWVGQGAQRLGLGDTIRKEAFLRLCENQHPETGELLTQRLNSTRLEGGQTQANRRIFFDFTFSPPKSVSILALAAGDKWIVEAHERAVRVAVQELEAFASTRVRVQNQQCDRETGNFVAALFTHETSRALDPHLHTHCIVFNATFDTEEKRWKALQNHGLLQARKFVENAYYHELARELRTFGYQIKNRFEGDFQVKGVTQELCDRFSKRDAQIDAALRKLLDEKPELQTANFKQLRADLAASERSRKQRKVSTAELRALWDGQMTRAERQTLHQLSSGSRPVKQQTTRSQVLEESVAWAEDHLFDRQSVVMECQIWQEALGRARGEDVSLADLKRVCAERGYLRDQASSRQVTLEKVWLREFEIVQTVREGIGECHPLVHEPGTPNPKLDGEQRQALQNLLGSIHRVTLFKGGAGTGKSFVLGDLARLAQEAGVPVITLAPQRQQVLDLESAGLPSPQTLAAFLQKPEIPRGGLIIVDEAGQVGGQQMVGLLRCVKSADARLVLSGDTRQHGPVEASDALVAIEKKSGLTPIELHTIRRQDPKRGKSKKERARIRSYRQAVEAAAQGQMEKSFRQLDQAGCVVACPMGTQAEALAEEYVKIAQTRDSVVVVSQTWSEVNRLNSTIRQKLKQQVLLGEKDYAVEVLDKVDLTDAQKRDARFHPENSAVLLNQSIQGFEAGSTGMLRGIIEEGVVVEVGGKILTISNRHLSRITICLKKEMLVTEGDRLHLKANRRLASGRRVTNGELVSVKSLNSDGSIALTDGRVLDASFREFMSGYAVTSYGSQGKTVDYVLFSDSAVGAATSSEQWYVSISRGRKGIAIFTPDKERLREAVCRSGHRPLALDLIPLERGREPYGIWNRLRPYLHRFGAKTSRMFLQLKSLRSRRSHVKPHIRQTSHVPQNSRMLVHRPERLRAQGRSFTKPIGADSL